MLKHSKTVVTQRFHKNNVFKAEHRLVVVTVGLSAGVAYSWGVGRLTSTMSRDECGAQERAWPDVSMKTEWLSGTHGAEAEHRGMYLCPSTAEVEGISSSLAAGFAVVVSSRFWDRLYLKSKENSRGRCQHQPTCVHVHIV